LGGENDEETDVPMQLLTSDEKVEELTHVIDHKDEQIEELKQRLQNSINPIEVQDQIEKIVQREVEERLKAN